MELRTLRYFLAIAREGSVTSAAEACHVTQPSISRQIAQLEAELGVQLFERGRHGATLTPQGLVLRERAETVIELSDRMAAEVRESVGELAGVIHVSCGEIGALETLAHLARLFRDEHPHVRFALTVANSRQALERMQEGLDDMGVFLGEVDHMRYESVRLSDGEEWVAVMARSNPLASRDCITVQNLEDQRLILPAYVSQNSPLMRWFGGGSVLADADACNLSTGGRQLARAGLGVALTVRGPAGSVGPDLVEVPLQPRISSEAHLIWRRDFTPSAASSAFIDYVRCQQA